VKRTGDGGCSLGILFRRSRRYPSGSRRNADGECPSGCAPSNRADPGSPSRAGAGGPGAQQSSGCQRTGPAAPDLRVRVQRIGPPGARQAENLASPPLSGGGDTWRSWNRQVQRMAPNHPAPCARQASEHDDPKPMGASSPVQRKRCTAATDSPGGRKP